MDDHERFSSDLSRHYSDVMSAMSAVTALASGSESAMPCEVIDAVTFQELPYAYRALATVALSSFFTGQTLLDNVPLTAMISKHFEDTDRFLEALHTDSLTGCLNIRGLADWVARKYDPYKNTYGVLAIDLTQFKQINDTLGHDVGDDALREVFKVIANVTRVPKRGHIPIDNHDRQHDTTDVICKARKGGDEFVVVMDFNGQDKQTAVFGLRRVESFLSSQRVVMTSRDGLRQASYGFRVGAVLVGPHRPVAFEQVYIEADQLCNKKRTAQDR